MNITVVGAGYVGLVVATGFAENGNTVTCVDRDADRIRLLSQGQLPMYEPGLEELLTRNLEEDRLRFSTDIGRSVVDSLLIFLCVGTPSNDTGQLDVAEVCCVAEEVGRALTGYAVIINKSTCPVGTTEQLAQLIAAQTHHPFDVVANPEFLKEGAAVDDFMRPDRVVIGCSDVRVQEIMRELYAPFLRTGKPFLAMGIRSAEMTKFAANSMLGARISMMNEFAQLCEAYGADITEVRDGVASDTRIGPAYLFPGLGFGGSCLPKDVVACAQLAKAKGIQADMLDAVTAVNERQQTRFIERILDHYGPHIAGKKLAVWGVSFKPRTDDIRNAPALRIIDALLNARAHVVVYDPMANDKVHVHFGGRVEIAPKSYAALEGADGLIVATEWNEFRRPDYAQMANLMKDRVIFDGRNLYTPAILAQHGFQYFSTGR